MQRLIYKAEALAREHPPRLQNRNKQVAYEIACPAGSLHQGEVAYTRWAAMPVPESIDAAQAVERVEVRRGIYDYSPVQESAVEWHVNFADPDLFFGYSSSLFAQDEMQVAEHPILGCLREALRACGHSTRTVEQGHPTPILVSGAERRCRIAVDVNPEEGRPLGLYGNLFARASEEVVRRATLRTDPPTLTNVIAMAAPSGGWGPYSRSDIEHILSTAYTAFRAAVLESKRFSVTGRPVVVHTGFWGCGAFGGNRIAMTILQVLAACLASIDRLVFHTVDASGHGSLDDALALLESGPAREGTEEIVKWILRQDLHWGLSDGN